MADRPSLTGRLSDAGRRLSMYPTGVLGRNRPWYFLNLVDVVAGSRTLEDAVSGKVIVITGASSGIGQETALLVGAAGGQVALVARGVDRLERTRDEVVAAGGTAHTHPCDLSDLDDIERLAGDLLDQYGQVDVLVNNAGRSIRRLIDKSYDRMHDFERTMQLNYFGAVRLILSVLPSMRERKSGHIVNVSSTGVQAKVPRFAGYVASKAALEAFSDCVAAELFHENVRFTTVFMPLVRTPMIEPTAMYKRFPAKTPAEAAEMLSDALIYRPRRIGTPVGNLAALGNAASPRTMDAVRNTAYRLFPDTGSETEPLSALAQTLARLGVHW